MIPAAKLKKIIINLSYIIIFQYGISAESSDVNQVIAVPGRPLDPSTRGFMEARFGHDFGQVRVHSDAVSAASARQLGAVAYTVGSDLMFGADQFSPQTFTGRRLLAHELVHTLQQGSSRTMVQRELLDCDDESCPERRASDEESWARGQGIRAEHVTTPETGFLVWGFPINSTSTAGLDSTPGWGPFWGNIVTRNVFWQVRGFTDCLGDDNVNMSLRHERARVARSALPSYAQDKVLSFFGAPLDQCIAVNTTKEGRHKNCSALFQMFTDPGREVTVATPEEEQGPTVVPATPEECSPAVPRETALDCTPNPQGAHLPPVGGTHTESHPFQPCFLTEAQVAGSPDWCVDEQQAHGGEVCYRQIPASDGGPADQYCYSVNCCHNSPDAASALIRVPRAAAPVVKLAAWAPTSIT